MTREKQLIEAKIDSVYRQIRDNIIRGRWAAGWRINQREVAVQLECSRMPIREALIRLAAEGLVVSRPNRGSVVAPLSIADMIEVYSAREALEPLLAKEGARKHEPLDILHMERILDAQREVVERGDAMAFLPLDRQFHLTLYRASSYLYIYGIVERLLDRAERYRHMYVSSPEHLLRSLSEHRTILLAVKNHQADNVADLTLNHVAKGRETLVGLIATEETLAGVDLQQKGIAHESTN